ncbi:DUF4376 domain-containing protein [Pseudomonas aeruginosa]
MDKYFSASTGGFYSLDFHGAEHIPGDAIELTDAEYEALKGKLIEVGADGRPTLVQETEQVMDPRALIAARRYQAETAGITVNGMPLDTGRDSQGLVTGAALEAFMDAGYTCQWKTGEGFVELSAQQIIALARAMRAHVQACFNREAALLAALGAGTYTDEQLDQGWPA